MNLNQQSIEALRNSGIPNYMHDAIINYYQNGWAPGGFLSALINNDLKETFAKADDTNIHCIKAYILWFYNHAPGGTWGYPNAVQQHMESFEGSAHA